MQARVSVKTPCEKPLKKKKPGNLKGRDQNKYFKKNEDVQPISMLISQVTGEAYVSSTTPPHDRPTHSSVVMSKVYIIGTHTHGL